MPCRMPSSDVSASSNPKWPTVEVLNVLGHHIQNDCGIRTDWHKTRNQMWASFWANLSHRVAYHIEPLSKALLLYRVVACLFLWKVSRWPFQISIAQELDSVQCQMIARIIPCVVQVNESLDHFCRRRLRQARNIASHAGLWSLSWAKRTIDWNEHILRGLEYQHFCAPLIEFHNFEWLQSQRSIYSNSQNSIFAGRTGSRLNIGRPQTRWATGIHNASTAIAARSTHSRGGHSLSLSTRLREAMTHVRNSIFPGG